MTTQASEPLSPLLEQMLEGNANQPDVRGVPDELLTMKGRLVKEWQAAPETAHVPSPVKQPESAPIPPALPEQGLPSDFDTHAAMRALFGDSKPALVGRGFVLEQLEALEAQPPELDHIDAESALIGSGVDESPYEFTPSLFRDLN